MKHRGNRVLMGLGLTLLTAAASSCASSNGATTKPSTTSPTALSTTSTSVPPTTSTPPTTADPLPSLAAPCGRSADPPATYEHVVVLVEENRTWGGGRTPPVEFGFSPTAMPFLHGLATKCAYYADWAETDGAQGSLTQYIGMTSGVDNPFAVTNCSPAVSCNSVDDNLFRQIRVSGGTPRTYVEGATAGCSMGSNAARHIPALYYWGGADRSYCPTEVRPLSELDPAHLPTLAFVVPDLCHDGHSCPDPNVDSFAKIILTPILNGPDYANRKTLVVVVYDEDEPVPNLLIAPTARAGPIDSAIGTHAALLKTIELMLGLPVMNQGQLPAAISLRPSAHM
jgi:acid phosphatase